MGWASMSKVNKILAILLVVLFVATVTALAVDAKIDNSKCNCRYNNGICNGYGNGKGNYGYYNGIGNGYGNGFGNCEHGNGIGNGYGNGNHGNSMILVPRVQYEKNYQRPPRYHKGRRSCAKSSMCS